MPVIFLSYFGQDGAVISPSPNDTELMIYITGSATPVNATLTVNGTTAPETSGSTTTAWSNNLDNVVPHPPNIGIVPPPGLGGPMNNNAQVVMFAVPANFTSGMLTMSTGGGTGTYPVSLYPVTTGGPR